MMTTLISFQDRRIPVYFSSAMSQKALDALLRALDTKITKGKSAMKKCLATLISIEVDGCEAVLHSLREEDSIALSLY
jgi:hypothetical protein